MKKYALGFVFIIISFILLGFNAKYANADVWFGGPGCTTGAHYSTTTGQPCGSWLVVDNGCAPGNLFSSETGKACSNTTQPNNSGALSQFNNLFSSFNNNKTDSNIKSLQQFLKDQGYYFGKIDGKYGKISARAVSDFQSDNNEVTNPPTTPSSITVLRPNGGEIWTMGTTQTISWQDRNLYITPCPTDTLCPNSIVAQLYDVNLISYNPPCTSNMCPMSSTSALYPIQAPRTIAKGIYGSSFDWAIPNCYPGHECSSNFEIPAGSYLIQVCKSGSSICDTSDNYFKIVSGTTVCTMEAKLCSDGKTYVSRTGPSCEFAACPVSTNPPVSDSGGTTVAASGLTGVVTSCPGTVQIGSTTSGCQGTANEQIDIKTIPQVSGGVSTMGIIGTYFTDQNGNYKVLVQPGTYVVCTTNGNFCSNATTVQLGKFSEANVLIARP